jgi:hypothetical protein
MYDNFLEDNETYIKLEAFWFHFFESILRENNIANTDWQYPFYNTAYVDGSKFFDGNPIFSAKSLVENKSVRIIQEERETKEGVYTYWVEEKEGPNPQLVIVCELSDKIIDEIKRLLTQWLLGDILASSMTCSAG